MNNKIGGELHQTGLRVRRRPETENSVSAPVTYFRVLQIVNK